MSTKLIELREAILVEEILDSLASGEFPSIMLAFDALGSTAFICLLAELAQPMKAILHRHGPGPLWLIVVNGCSAAYKKDSAPRSVSPR